MEINKIEGIIKNLTQVFFDAGDLSIELRNKGLKKHIKEDKTPVTNGDIEVNNIILKNLRKISPTIPIISEETSENKNLDLNTFWLIDPIDGTYDYINNRDEFTLNAGLIVNKVALAGIIYAPAKNRMFYTYGNNISYELKDNKEKVLNNKNIDKNNIKAVSYSNNLKPEIIEIHKKLRVKEYIKMKSSLKFCVIAAGEFHVYAAEPRANEWDIAAGHAILKNSGGVVTDFNEKEILYGKSGFKNPSIILKSTADL
jgi:3'(2'), 5'-bisphosphate nucleotidase